VPLEAEAPQDETYDAGFDALRQRGSRPPCPTSCGRPSPGSWPSSTRPTCRTPTSTRCWSRRGPEGRARGSADRRDPVPLGARERQGGRSPSAGPTRCPCSRRSSPTWRAPPPGPGSSSRPRGDGDVDLPLRPRMLRMIVENLAENAIRYAGHGSQLILEVTREGDTGVPDGGRRRGRCRRGCPAAALRAVLPGRRGAHHPRHRARACDREAHRGRRGRRRRGAGRQGRRAPHPLHLPARLTRTRRAPRPSALRGRPSLAVPC